MSNVVLVSGGNRGVGRAIVERLHADGYRISVGARDLADLDWLSNSASILKCKIELRDQESIRRWVRDSVARFGQIDALVNNAGFSADVRLDNDDEGVLIKCGRSMPKALCASHALAGLI